MSIVFEDAKDALNPDSDFSLEEWNWYCEMYTPDCDTSETGYNEFMSWLGYGE